MPPRAAVLRDLTARDLTREIARSRLGGIDKGGKGHPGDVGGWVPPSLPRAKMGTAPPYLDGRTCYEMLRFSGFLKIGKLCFSAQVITD